MAMKMSLLVLAASFVLLSSVVYATEFTSTNFQVLDPVMFHGGYSSSQSYQLQGSVAQMSIGTSTSSNFEVRAGFLYFPGPTASSPEPTPEPTPTPTPTPSGGTIPGLVRLFFPASKAPLLPKPLTKCGVADFNCDGVVDLADLSALLYLSAYSPLDNPADINNDQSIDLADASSLFYYWTENKIFELARIVDLAYEPYPLAVSGGKPTPFAKTSPRPFIGYQKENGLATSALLSWKTLTDLVIRVIDAIAGIVQRIWQFFLEIVNI